MNNSFKDQAAVCAAAVEVFALFAGKLAAADAGSLRAVIDELIVFARKHAEDEESSMIDCGYHLTEPEDHALHCSAHRRLEEGLNGICQLLDGGADGLVAATQAFVHNWVALHWLTSQRLRRYCGESGQPAAPGSWAEAGVARFA